LIVWQTQKDLYWLNEQT